MIEKASRKVSEPEIWVRCCAASKEALTAKTQRSPRKVNSHLTLAFFASSRLVAFFINVNNKVNACLMGVAKLHQQPAFEPETRKAHHCSCALCAFAPLREAFFF